MGIMKPDFNKSSKGWFYAAVLLISGGVFALQVVLAQVVAVVFNYDFRFLSATLAIFGLGSGGIFVSVFFEKIIERFSKSVLLAAALYAVTTILPFLFTRGAPPSSDTAAFVLTAIFLSSFLNFFFAGFVLSLFFSSEKKYVTKIYFFDLIGAALTAILVVWLADFFGFYVTIYFIFLLGISAFLSCLFFYGDFVSVRGKIAAVVLSLSLFCLVTAFPMDVDCRAGNLIKKDSNSFSQVHAFLIERGNDFLRFDLTINCFVRATGLVARDIGDYREALEGFRFTPFMFGQFKKTLIVGSGAGIDVERALLAGSKEITAVEINPLLVDLTNDLASGIGVSPYKNEKVKTVIGEARAFVSRTEEKYDLILIAHTKNFGRPLGANLFVPKNLYTQEAFAQYQAKLTDDGVIAVIDFVPFSRQYLKTFNQVVTRQGANPSDYFLVLTNFGNDDLAGFSEAATELILFKKSGLSAKDKETAGKMALRYHLISYDDPVRELLNGDIKSLTDDRPFLWQPIKNAKNLLAYPAYLIPTFGVLNDFLAVFAASLIILLAAVFVFLKRFRQNQISAKAPLFFIGISFGLAATEFVLINKVTLVLGNPVYSHVIVLSVVLLFCGLGSLAARFGKIRENFRKISFIMPVLLLFYYFLIDRLVAVFSPLAYEFKILLITVVAFPLSFLAGMFFPWAFGEISKKGDKFLPWLWGIDSLAFVAASLAISFAVLYFGVKVILLVGVAGYLLSAFCTKNISEARRL